ncbi:four helix bundle suffix domain-containing protein [Geomonas nitrogeniifigens]|uniref:Four helix bundle suffix domain-containing protein n=1 Tax=Geomonas diazotrophica TaxID=2843197 RepID=A0ABX8JH94_9BACT|nr:four helix bundle suffix domain-containing protein [Geomonas nitrogeniifigens]QWV97750.1 four helix bundle suffix domain-containing protein [Geomonas nitrogeniifigens]QXE86887.1 four helix bundle suffix domain-containing protein [Geomonas nitrogeniifigens]
MKNGNHGNYGSNGKDVKPQEHQLAHASQPSPTSHEPATPLLPPRGDYHTLLSYQKAAVIYEITYRFCHRFLSRGDRTVDQMVQAARSGKQNIIEGSKAATTSKETEIKLTNVARASLEELLEDYRDYLSARDLTVWDKDSREALYVRKLGRSTPFSFELLRGFTETRHAIVVANIAICLIHQANFLLDQQLKGLEKSFLKEGGLRERMTHARLMVREQQRKEP